jgi:CDP-glucose 4,6-dehydratase
LLKAFLQEYGQSAYPVEVVPSNLPEANFLRLDISKAKIELKWQPILNFGNTMQLTASWYKEFAAGQNARELMLKQIAQYQSLM